MTFNPAGRAPQVKWRKIEKASPEAELCAGQGYIRARTSDDGLCPYPAIADATPKGSGGWKPVVPAVAEVLCTNVHA